jgi:leucine dehydrogenase
LPPREGLAGGDPSPKTAFGVFTGIEAAARFKLSRDSLAGIRVAVQGVGNVGYNLCRYLAKAGARLVVADMDDSRVAAACSEFGATAAPLDQILFQDVDVVAPCALGAILNERTIAKITARIVAGGANNQLESREDGRRLSEAGILYAPDYVINGGGIINVASEYRGQGDDESVMQRVAAIGPRLTRIFEEASATGRPTNLIADELARKIIEAAESR